MNTNASPKQIERIDLHTATDDIGRRLEQINDNLRIIRRGLSGDNEEQSPRGVPDTHLESKIFSFGDTLAEILRSTDRIAERLGISMARTDECVVQKPRGLKSYAGE